MNEHTALQCESVYACINVLSSDMSSLPLKVYQQTEKGRVPAVDHDLYYLLTVEPNPEMTAPVFLGAWIGSAVLNNNGYAEIQRNGVKPVALWPRDPRSVKMKRAAGGEPIGKDLRAAPGELLYECTDTGTPRYVQSANMLHLVGFSRDGWIGHSPLHSGKQTIGAAMAAMKFIGGFFGRGSRPSGILTMKDPTMKAGDPRLDIARKSWESANGGDNQGRTAVLPGDWSWTAIGISPEQMQFLQIGQFTRSQIAGIFRVPPHMIGDTSRLSNGNHESVAQEYVTFTLRPWLARIEAEVQRKLMPRRGPTAGTLSVAFDYTDLIKGDFGSQMNGYAVGKQWGFYNTNEIKQKLGENPIGPEGDIYYVPLNMVPMGQESEGGDGNQGGDGSNGGAAGAGQDSGDGAGDGAQPAGNGGRNQMRLLQRMGDAYGGLFRDACGRLQARSKRDGESVAQVMGPVLDAIAAEATRQAQSMFRVKPDADLGTEKILRDCRAAILKRSADWKPEEYDAELQRTLRAITLGIFREAGSQLALAA